MMERQESNFRGPRVVLEQPRARDLRFGLHPPGLVGFFCALRVGDHRVANTNFGACERDEKSDFEMGAAADP